MPPAKDQAMRRSWQRLDPLVAKHGVHSEHLTELTRGLNQATQHLQPTKP